MSQGNNTKETRIDFHASSGTTRCKISTSIFNVFLCNKFIQWTRNFSTFPFFETDSFGTFDSTALVPCASHKFVLRFAISGHFPEEAVWA
jgi:hypothetical protein